MNRQELLSWIRAAGEEQFSRSGGPGGQNVNKVNTKVVLKLPVDHIPDLTPEELERLQTRLGNRLTNDGELIIQSSEDRSQFTNRRIAEQRAADLIIEAMRTRPTRKPSRPGKAAKERRLQEKKQRSLLKKSRKPPAKDG